MFRWLFPRQPVFQEQFQKAVGVVLAGASAYADMMADYRDVELKARKIRSLEHDGDRITHDTIERKCERSRKRGVCSSFSLMYASCTSAIGSSM